MIECPSCGRGMLRRGSLLYCRAPVCGYSNRWEIEGAHRW